MHISKILYVDVHRLYYSMYISCVKKVHRLECIKMKKSFVYFMLIILILTCAISVVACEKKVWIVLRGLIILMKTARSLKAITLP